MLPALLVRFRPAGPWRFGPDSGARDRVDTICHSDTVYSAVTAMMSRLGCLEEWLAATTTDPAVRFSSLFPYHGDSLYVTPPRSLWPPATSSRVRWASAQFVPMSIVESLLTGKSLDEDNWIVDGASGCLVQAAGRFRGAGPFRVDVRPGAAVDRLHEGVAPHATACMEFAEEAGMWGLAEFAGDEAREQWGHKVRSALRLLADSGIGGERSRGWGRSSMPSIRDGKITELIFRNRTSKNGGVEIDLAPESENARWLLSVFSPGPADAVDWRSGNYQIVCRSGRVESPARSGELKKELRMVAEGSILVSPVGLKGGVKDVAPDGFPHPVYRAGFALSVPIRWGKPVPPTPSPAPMPVVVEALPVVVEPPPVAVEEVPVAVDDAPAPVEDLPVPAEDSPAPPPVVEAPPVLVEPPPVAVEDLPAPAEDLPAPAEDLPAPVEDMPVPAEDLPAPVEPEPAAEVPPSKKEGEVAE